MTLGVARLFDTPLQSGNASSGTAFAVSPTLALTALHCVSDFDGFTESASVTCQSLTWLRFGKGGAVRAQVIGYDTKLDVALLQMCDALPPEIEPIALTSGCFEQDLWYSLGFPDSVVANDGLDGFAISGRVTYAYATIRDGQSPAIQLSCRQSAAGAPLAGVSGAPVLLSQPVRAVGIIRWEHPSAKTNGLAVGAEIYASPVGEAAQALPRIAELIRPSAGPQPQRNASAERQLMQSLPLSSKGRLGRPLVRLGAVALIAVLLTGAGSTAVARTIWDHKPDLPAPTNSSGVGVTKSSAPSRPRNSKKPASTHKPTPTRTNPPDVPNFQPPRVQSRSCADTEIKLNPSSGPVGTTLRIVGSCFESGERIEITFHTTVISQPTADEDGSFSTTGKVPESYAKFGSNQYRVTASGKQSVRFDSQPFDLTGD
ncbi:hypothetical protein GCM10020358_65340 [Amorphoplanes nipponensis]|uniref:Trypsin-like peptidase domain-containing protein n=1 Tax=Actinoplanes nipponensis TaxID=135950 RepID=A0A919JM15_9ACTN|nr:serine protease [Actinoplanes nipponensis]GIE51646.1 hypothetical protein Ani05nite_51800 [Actinoplanes nipponensis]